MTEQPQRSPHLPSPGGAAGPGGAPAPYAPAPPPGAYAAPAGSDGPWGPLADWGSRVGASLLDGLVSLVGLLPLGIGFALIASGIGSSGRYDPQTTTFGEPSSTDMGLVGTGSVLVGVGVLVLFGIQLWNRTFRQGRTGQSVGKSAMGIRLVAEHTGQPVGAGMSFIREICHNLDGIFYLGYLWPLWDPKRQTFADKVLGTVVIRVPKG